MKRESATRHCPVTAEQPIEIIYDLTTFMTRLYIEANIIAIIAGALSSIHNSTAARTAPTLQGKY